MTIPTTRNGSEIPTMQDIITLQEIARNILQVEYPAENHHSAGVCVREFRMPARHFVIGKEHKTRHLNLLVTGSCTVWTVHGRYELDATHGPRILESMAGVKKVVLAHTDIVWLTVHATNETDPDRLENEVIMPEEQLDLFPELDSIKLAGGNKPWLGVRSEE